MPVGAIALFRNSTEEKKEKQNMASNVFDVAVVGGGLSGMTAARDLIRTQGGPPLVSIDSINSKKTKEELP